MYVQVGLFAFWIAFLYFYKDCPLDLCKKARKKLNFMPFTCFFCTFSWICILLILGISIIKWFGMSYLSDFVLNVGGSLGIGLLAYIFLDNFAMNQIPKKD